MIAGDVKRKRGGERYGVEINNRMVCFRKRRESQKGRDMERLDWNKWESGCLRRDIKLSIVSTAKPLDE